MNTGALRTRGKRWFMSAGLALMLCSGLAAPVLAHGPVWDGDSAHFFSDMVTAFGVPLFVLVVGALVGIGLSSMMSRRESDDDLLDDEALEPEDEPLLSDQPDSEPTRRQSL